MDKITVTFEQVQNWLGSDENFHHEEAIKTLVSIANGEYKADDLLRDVLGYK